MIRTPWGDPATLRDRKLAPGLRLPPEEVARNQQARLFAATVATVAQKGYEATRIEDLVRLSGVSRSAFYSHFPDKRACFLATAEAMVAFGMRALDAPDANGADPDRAGERFDALVRTIVEQAAGARICFVEAYAAGPEAVRMLERAASRFEAFVQEELVGPPGRTPMPSEIVRALTGALCKMFQNRLYRGEEGRLAELAPRALRWALSYSPPPRTLRPPRRRRLDSQPTSAQDPVGRILRAVATVAARSGYPGMTVADVVAQASTSQSTFYANFANREAALLAALDQGSAQLLATVLPAFRRAPDWPRGIRVAIESLLAFGATEPELTQLIAVEASACGPRALEQRDAAIGELVDLLAGGYELAPGVSPVAGELIGGAIYTLILDRVRQGRSEDLPGLAPVATYLALAPFLGPEEACAVASG
jgi:AcrR family transcriptional regulator